MRVASLFRSKYFYIWLNIKALVSLYYWSHDASLEKMTIFVFIFAMVFNAMLADLEAAKDRNIDLK